MAIHGGAGESEWEHMDSATAAAYRASLTKALEIGVARLKSGARSLDAVEAAIEVLEDDPLLECRPRSGVYGGRQERDGCFHYGWKNLGSWIGSRRAIHQEPDRPGSGGNGEIALRQWWRAREQMLLRKRSVSRRCRRRSLTEMRWDGLREVLRKNGKPMPSRPAGVPKAPRSAATTSNSFSHRFGTVGAVARDVHGTIAAGTSTGGMQGKMPGRVGDSPIIGAATCADDKSCAVSSTGVGEYFIGLSVAKEICSLVQYRGMSIRQAADFVIQQEVAQLKGGEGGVIVLDPKSEPVWSYNTLGMFRARQTGKRAAEVEVEKK